MKKHQIVALVALILVGAYFVTGHFWLVGISVLISIASFFIRD